MVSPAWRTLKKHAARRGFDSEAESGNEFERYQNPTVLNFSPSDCASIPSPLPGLHVLLPSYSREAN
jgi:hypothetical protein